MFQFPQTLFLVIKTIEKNKNNNNINKQSSNLIL